MRIRPYFLYAWNMMDPLYFFCSRLHCIESSKENGSILRVRLMRYKGKEVVLSDGTMIKKKDMLIKIHLQNARIIQELQDIDNELKKALILYKKVKDSLPYLALYVHNHKIKEEIKGIMGITMLTKGAERLGFESHPISSRFFRCFKLLTQYPIYLLSKSQPLPKGRKKPSPTYLFMSKDILFKKYGIT